MWEAREKETRCRCDKCTELIGGWFLETVGLTLCFSDGLEWLEHENLGRRTEREPRQTPVINRLPNPHWHIVEYNFCFSWISPIKVKISMEFWQILPGLKHTFHYEEHKMQIDFFWGLKVPFTDLEWGLCSVALKNASLTLHRWIVNSQGSV